jgi:hypothetical protein
MNIIFSPGRLAAVALIAAIVAAAPISKAQAPRNATAAPENEVQLIVPQTLFDWAQRAFYSQFPGYGNWSGNYYFRTPETQASENFNYRYYRNTKNYVGMAGDDVYVAGPVGGNSVTWVGKAADFACNVNPNACGSNGPEDGPMFVLDFDSYHLTVLRHKAPHAGTAVIGSSAIPTSDKGLATEGFGGQMFYDGSNDRLFVSAASGLWIFDNAKSMSGSVTATRKISIAGLKQVGRFVYDRLRDRAYLLEMGFDELRFAILNNVSKRSGPVIADRMFKVDRSFNAFAIDATRSIGYFTSNDGVIVVPNIDGLSGDTLPTARSFSLGATATYRGIAVDAQRDRLYIGDNGITAGVHIVANASSVVGRTSSQFVQTPLAWWVTLDAANDRLYVSDATQVTLLNRASQLKDGALPWDAVVMHGPYAASFGAVTVP